MHKTTLYLDEATLVEIRQLAQRRGTNQATVVREALSEYLAKSSRPRPKGIGAYTSGQDDVSERAEEILGSRPRPGDADEG
jgi:hypothetical protein